MNQRPLHLARTARAIVERIAVLDLDLSGLQVLTEAEFNAAKVAEHEARRPYPSWIGYSDTMTWTAPVARPADAIMNGGNVRYQWDEATVNWIPAE